MPSVEHQLDSDGFHDEDECQRCLEEYFTCKCECRCGRCCEALIIEATLLDAEREPRIAAMGSPIVDDMATGQRELIGYLLNGPGGACVFFDSQTRLCTIHNTRPG